jgi:uncharacterized protein YPO0396
VRDLTRHGRETANLRIFGENAFTLLNRAAGLKQINRIDEIFRELVLEDRSAFNRALDVAGEFDNLAGIHGELELARKKQESLKPVAEEYERLLKSQKKAERLRTLKRILPIWFAIAGKEKWSHVLELLIGERDKQHASLQLELENHAACRLRVETMRERYLELGGNVISELETTIGFLTERREDKAKQTDYYRKLVKTFKLSEELSERSLQHYQALLTERRLEIQKQRDHQQEKKSKALSELREQNSKLKDTEAMLQKVQERPGSNIPPRFQDFRADLAGQLSLHEGDLPFLAELVEVKPEDSAWRGAIERAMGAERLRILVPDESLEQSRQCNG